MAGKRTLKRQLNLPQVIMLGTAGTLGSGVFILSGHAAAIAGPAAIWAVLIAGVKFQHRSQLLRTGNHLSRDWRRDDLRARSLGQRLDLIPGRLDGLYLQHFLHCAFSCRFCLLRVRFLPRLT